VLDAFVDHAVAGDPEQEGGLGVFDQQLVKGHDIGQFLLGGRGKSGGDGAQEADTGCTGAGNELSGLILSEPPFLDESVGHVECVALGTEAGNASNLRVAGHTPVFAEKGEYGFAIFVLHVSNDNRTNVLC